MNPWADHEIRFMSHCPTMKRFDWIRKKRKNSTRPIISRYGVTCQNKTLGFSFENWQNCKIPKYVVKFEKIDLVELGISGLHVSLDDMRILQSAYLTFLSNDENEFILDEFSVQNVQNYKLVLAPDIHPFRPLEPLFVTCWSNTQWMKPPVRNKKNHECCTRKFVTNQL